MDTCKCGRELRQFWTWRDGNDTPHASAFRPSVDAKGPILAASARDALAILDGQPQPRHDVFTGDLRREGRCRAQAVAAQAAS